jgi:hypothetical protein
MGYCAKAKEEKQPHLTSPLQTKSSQQSIPTFQSINQSIPSILSPSIPQRPQQLLPPKQQLTLPTILLSSILPIPRSRTRSPIRTPPRRALVRETARQPPRKRSGARTVRGRRSSSVLRFQMALLPLRRRGSFDAGHDFLGPGTAGSGSLVVSDLFKRFLAGDGGRGIERDAAA